MRSFWSDPFLWIHLAGLAVLPILLEVCLLGLAVGDPVLPVWLELFFLIAIGTGPIVWMQWQRPFYIFSIVALAMKPEQLNPNQQRILSLFKKPENRILVIAAAVTLAIVLRQLYYLAPIASDVAPFAPEWRLAGLLLAAGAFLASNLFLQVPIFVLRVLLTSETNFLATQPYPVEKIRQDFSILGWQLNQILPPMETEIQPTPVLQVAPVNDISAEALPTNSEPQTAESENLTQDLPRESE